MPLTVRLQTIKNEKLEEVVPPDALLDRILPIGDRSFPLLQFIDEYGNAIFNGRQMPQFLKEWDVVMRMVGSKEQQEALPKIRHLAIRCENEPHLFLRFIGD